jgi:hypothetical protein
MQHSPIKRITREFARRSNRVQRSMKAEKDEPGHRYAQQVTNEQKKGICAMPCQMRSLSSLSRGSASSPSLRWLLQHRRRSAADPVSCAHHLSRLIANRGGARDTEVSIVSATATDTRSECMELIKHGLRSFLNCRLPLCIPYCDSELISPTWQSNDAGPGEISTIR